MKRFRRIKPKPQTLLAQWVRVDAHNGPELCYAFGEGCDRSDMALLNGALAVPPSTVQLPESLRTKWWTANTRQEPSLIQELEARGYDLTTLRFSIQKKGAP